MSGATPIWRGVVIEVTSGERYYFTQLERLVEILREHLGKLGLADGGSKGLLDENGNVAE